MWRRELTVMALCLLCTGLVAAQVDDRPGKKLERSPGVRLLERSTVKEAQLAAADKYRSSVKAKPSRKNETASIPDAVPVDRTLKGGPKNTFVIGGGYMYESVRDLPVDHLHGVAINAFYYPLGWLGFGAQYEYGQGSSYTQVGTVAVHNQLTRHVIVAGPEVSGYPGDTLRVFVRPLFGVAKDRLTTHSIATTRTSVEDTNFALEVGGGMDLRLRGPIAWRLFEFNYLGIKRQTFWQNNYRLGTGITFLGGH